MRFNLLILFFVASATLPAQDSYLKQSAFDQELDKPLSAVRKDVPVREFLERLSEERHIAIWLDRRIDPSQTIDVAISNQFLDDAINSLAQQVEAHVVTVADTLLVLPGSQSPLRTQIFLSDEQLENVVATDVKRKFELSRRQTLEWDDLATPREIVMQIATSYGIQVQNPELIPHDLWKAGALSYPNANEALNIILSRYKLGVIWELPDQMSIVEVETIPAVEQKHRLRSVSLDEGLAKLKQRFPDKSFNTDGSRIVFSGLIEEHEQAAYILGEKTPRKRQMDSTTPPLENRRFTLRMVRKPFMALVKGLEQQGIMFHYDEAELTGAGVDLLQKISFEVENATPQELLNQACGEVGLDFEIDGLTVHLKVAQ